jgi:cytochrome c-type biogenesis protein CcmE
MTPRVEHTGPTKNGLPVYQWVSIMLTLAGMIITGVFYITNMEKRISLLERQGTENQSTVSTLQQTVSIGMGKRLEIQRDADNMKQNFKDWRDENNKAHEKIELALTKLLEEKRVSDLRNLKQDFIP